jgi:hypothetical protein
MGIYAFDIEMYPNLFLIVFIDVNTREIFRFEISPRRNDVNELIVFLRKAEVLIGFNILEYDYPVLHELLRVRKRLKGRHLVSHLYKKSQKVIKAEVKYFVRIKNPLLKLADLFQIHHFNNKAKMTSLKLLEFNMRMEKVEELPYPFDTVLTNEQIQKVVEYCDNDVIATLLFFFESIDKIKFRKQMSQLYSIDLTNFNDVKIGEEILIQAIVKETGIPREKVTKMRTYRPEGIAIKDIIFPYIKFESVELNTFIDWWRTKVIYETKGQFDKIPLEEVEEIFQYTDQITVKKGTLLKKLNIRYKGFQFDFGTGGLHGTQIENKSGVWKQDDEHDIILVDVSSYYPNMAAKNYLSPKHFDTNMFVRVINKLYAERMEAKDKGDKEKVKAIKLALNGALYGKSNSEFSCIFDPKFMMNICVNGQLSLVMLTEQFLDTGIEVIQVNTDGILVRVHKSKREELDRLCKEWMRITQLKLDYDFFTIIVQRDVNNYFGVMDNGYVKRKGTFDYMYKENGDWHKNFSMLVVSKAVEAYFVNDILPENFITNHSDIYDFYKRTKVPKSSRLEGRKMENKECIEVVDLQNVTRYFVSNEGLKLIKIMPPLKDKVEDREIGIEVAFECTPCNTLLPEQEVRDNLNYQYYIGEAYKIINKVENNV